MEARKDRISIIVVFPCEVRWSYASKQKIKWTNRSKNLFETDTVISISGRKNSPLGCYPTIFDHTKAKNTTSARSKRLDHQRWRCAEQPKATKGKALRPLRTVLGKRIQDKNLAFRAKLIDRGYPETLIMTTLSKIKFEDRKLALQQKCKEDKRILSFVAQYRPTVPNLKQILMQKWHLIPTGSQLSEILRPVYTGDFCGA